MIKTDKTTNNITVFPLTLFTTIPTQTAHLIKLL